MEANEKQGIGTRISELIFRLDKNQSSFAKSIGFTQAAVYSTVHGKSKPKYEFLESVLKAYPKVNRDWLLEGKGEMFLDTDVKTSTVSGVPELWQDLKEQYEKRIKELEIFKFLYCQEKGIPNFLDPNTGRPKMVILENEIEFLIGA